MKFIKNIFNNSLTKSGALLIGATIFSNFCNFLFNAYLGRAISLADFALISLIVSILGLSDVFTGSLGTTISYKSALFFGKYGKPDTEFRKKMKRRLLLFSLLGCAVWVMLSPFIANYFHISSLLPVIILVPIWLLNMSAVVDSNYISGMLLFKYLAIVSTVEAITKLAATVAIVSFGFPDFAYTAIALSSLVSFALLNFGAKKIDKHGVEKRIKKTIKATFPIRFYLSNVLTKLSSISYLSLDVILANHFLSPTQAGEYVLLSLAGKTVYLAGSLFGQFILPVVTHKEGKGDNSKKTFSALLLATAATGFCAFLVVGLFGKYTMPILFGNRVLPILKYLIPYSLSMLAFTVAIKIVVYHQIKNRYGLSVVSFLLAIAQIVGISLFHKSVGSVVEVMTVLGFASFVLILAFHFLYPSIITLMRNLADFLDLLIPDHNAKSEKGLRIIIFNWRDTKHIWAGGAEVYVDELAKQWAKDGNTVTIFCGNDGLSKRNEFVDGIRIIRRGGFYTVYIWACLYYIFKFRKNYDVVVDSENGIPFFTPLFSTKPVVLLIHHVHQEIFIEYMKFPFSYFARFVEGKVMPWVYKNRTIVTVSESTKSEIIKNNIGKEKQIKIINPGITVREVNAVKTSFPSFIYLGRLKPYKNIDIAIKAFAHVSKKFKNAKLFIVGEGDSLQSLMQLSNSLNLSGKVKFFKKVSENKKILLLSQSWVSIQPSQVEGWGITVIEANACKTPVIASNTNGLKDSIIDGKTGILVAKRDVEELTQTMKNLVEDKAKRERLSRDSYLWSKNFSWEKNAKNFYSILSFEYQKQKEEVFGFKPIRLLSRFTSLF